MKIEVFVRRVGYANHENNVWLCVIYLNQRNIVEVGMTKSDALLRGALAYQAYCKNEAR